MEFIWNLWSSQYVLPCSVVTAQRPGEWYKVCPFLRWSFLGSRANISGMQCCIYMLDLFREIESFSQECFDWNVMLTFRPWMFHCWSLWRSWQRMQMTVKRRMNLDIQKVGNISLRIIDLFYYLISQYFLWIFMLKYDFYSEIYMSYFITTEKYEKKFYILISKCYWLFLVKRKIGYQ